MEFGHSTSRKLFSIPLVSAVATFTACAQSVPPPPLSQVIPVISTLHGVQVSDPYRWLEDGSSANTRTWIAAQQQYTAALLSSRPSIEALRAKTRELVDLEETHRAICRSQRCFIDKKPAGGQKSSIFLRAESSGEERLLIDAAGIGSDPADTVELLNVSSDGRLMAYGVRRGGRDQLSIRFRDVDAGRDLESDTLPEARYLYWSLPIAPDRSSVYYVRFDDAGPRLIQHRFGHPSTEDIVLFGQKLDPTQLLAALLSPDGNYLLATVLHGASGATDLYLKDLRSAAPFVPVVAGVPATFSGSIRGHTLYVETNWQAGRGRVFVADLDQPQQEHWKLLVPELPEATLEAIALTSDRLVVNSIRNAHSELLVYTLDGRPQPSIPLPGIGAVDTLDADPASPQLNFSYTSFDTPTGFYRWSSGAVEPLSAPAAPAALRDIVIDQVWYASTGGARVPMFLAHRRDLKPDGNLPVLLYGYGGFSWSQLPTFSPEEAVWIERGGVYAVANIRGGSEFGEAWHRDGELDKKQNSFDDFANAGRWLIANHYTRPERLAIQGLSNGGLLVTASITQHPELFAAAIGRYPLIDMIRSERFSIARWWISEYGSVENADQFRILYQYSPYHHVVRGTRYPAVLFITGDGDTRVDPSHARKMTAMLQSATSSGKPILLLYDAKSGHSGTLSADVEVEQTANELEFLTWQLHCMEPSR
jgi:prolyl oligopeptidase